jgi:hypothetical protein
MNNMKNKAERSLGLKVKKQNISCISTTLMLKYSVFSLVPLADLSDCQTSSAESGAHKPKPETRNSKL